MFLCLNPCFYGEINIISDNSKIKHNLKVSNKSVGGFKESNHSNPIETSLLALIHINKKTNKYYNNQEKVESKGVYKTCLLYAQQNVKKKKKSRTNKFLSCQALFTSRDKGSNGLFPRKLLNSVYVWGRIIKYYGL